VENRRLPDGRVNQRHVLYLGELNGRQERSWRKTVEIFDTAVRSQGERPSSPKSICPKTAKTISLPTWAFAFPSCAWKDPGSGEPAGWSASFGGDFVCLISGVSDCRRGGRERAGITSCKLSHSIV